MVEQKYSTAQIVGKKEEGRKAERGGQQNMKSVGPKRTVKVEIGHVGRTVLSRKVHKFA